MKAQRPAGMNYLKVEDDAGNKYRLRIELAGAGHAVTKGVREFRSVILDKLAVAMGGAAAVPVSPIYLTWTDFGEPGRVHVLGVHGSEEIGVRRVKRWRKVYPGMKLVAVPRRVGSDDLRGADAALVAGAPVLFS